MPASSAAELMMMAFPFTPPQTAPQTSLFCALLSAPLCSLGSGLNHAEDLKHVVRLLTSAHSDQRSFKAGRGGQRPRGPSIVMLQSSGSYFAYEVRRCFCLCLAFHPLVAASEARPVHSATSTDWSARNNKGSEGLRRPAVSVRSAPLAEAVLAAQVLRR